jgi:SAM-dependent methyltransferase
MDDSGREYLARELHGHGVEFGPGCKPLKLGPFVSSIRYCDAHDRAGFRELFPEVGGLVEQFPDPIDFRLHFDREPFVDRIGRGSLDFVVANHLLEHLVNPIRFLEQCYEVLAPDGLLFLGLPDKRCIFDRDRRRTPLSDLLARYEAGAKEVSDEQIAEFVNQVDRPAEPLRPGDAERSAEFAWHRIRSIHVNVWVLDDVLELFTYLGRRMGMPWALYDGAIGEGEFLLLFRKTDRAEVCDLYPLTLSRLYDEAGRRHLERQLAVMAQEIAETCRFVRGFKKVASAVPGGGALRKWVKKG